MLKKIILVTLSINTLQAIQIAIPAEELLAKLTLHQKIGQLLIVAAASNFSQNSEAFASTAIEIPYNTQLDYIENLIKNYEVGGIIFLGHSDPASQIKITQRFQSLTRIPLLIAQDSEWGLSMRLNLDSTKVVRYPHNLTLGAIVDQDIIYKVGYEIGKQCAAIGVHLNLAPVVDINTNQANPVIHDRAFGDNPERVAQIAKSFTSGLQAAGILACAKHFPGHGDTSTDSHLDLPIVMHNRARLDQIELIPFKALIQLGVAAIMHAHLAIPTIDATGTPASLSHTIVTTLLQQTLGYQGLSITDGLGMRAVNKHYAPGQIELAAFLAGNDILLCPLDAPKAIDLIAAEILAGKISEAELDRRVLKVLRAKQQVLKQVPIGIYQQHYLTRPSAYALQAQAYRAAITLVPQATQPINFNSCTLTNSCIIQIGKLSENLFTQLCKQSACNVLNCSAKLKTQELDACLAATQKKDTVIMVIAELNKLAGSNFGVAQNTLNLVAQLKEMGKSIVLVIFGTPYSVSLFKDIDIIVAYEDITVTQQAVFDVLTGTLQPSGILPVNLGALNRYQKNWCARLGSNQRPTD